MLPELELAASIERLAVRVTALCDDLNRMRAVNRELVEALKVIHHAVDTGDIRRAVVLARIAIQHAETQP